MTVLCYEDTSRSLNRVCHYIFTSPSLCLPLSVATLPVGVRSCHGPVTSLRREQWTTVNQEIHAVLKSCGFSLKLIPRKSSVI